MGVKFKMLATSKVDPTLVAGDVVYRLSKYDYGSARTDSAAFGFSCVSVTRDQSGDYPFIVVPEHDLEAVQ